MGGDQEGVNGTILAEFDSGARSETVYDIPQRKQLDTWCDPWTESTSYGELQMKSGRFKTYNTFQALEKRPVTLRFW